MTSIQNNIPTPLTVRYMAGPHAREMTFIPGINLDVPNEDVDLLEQHATFKVWQKHKVVKVLNRTPSTEGELEGFEVSTRKEDHQPIPHQEVRKGVNSTAPTNLQENMIPIEDIDSDISIREAEDSIKTSFNLDALIALGERDSRKGIKELVNDRVDELNNTGLNA